jgi:hypothetical protein
MAQKMDKRWFKRRLDAIAADMGGKQIMSARQQPEADAKPQQCFANVDRKVAREGGLKVFGWTPHWRRVEAIPGPGYLFLTHHAVWVSRDGLVVDVTPYPDAKHAPLSLNPDYSPVIIDMDAVPNGSVSLPLRFIALDENNSELIAYVAELNAKEAEHHAAALAAAASA